MRGQKGERAEGGGYGVEGRGQRAQGTGYRIEGMRMLLANTANIASAVSAANTSSAASGFYAE